MKAIWKWVIAGAVILAVGLIILITTLAVNGWTINAEFEMQTFKASENNTYLEIDIGASMLKTEFYDGDKIEISYPTSKSLKTEIFEKEGRLKFESKLKWFARLFNSPQAPETVIKLPKDKIFDLEIDLGAGTITLAGGAYGNIEIDVGAGTLNADGITCSSLLCDVGAGKIDITSLTCPDIKADVGAGKFDLSIKGVKSEYNISAKVGAGDCNVSNQTGTTDKKLTVNCGAGEINVKFILDQP